MTLRLRGVCADRVLVRLDKPSETTESGRLYVPEAAKVMQQSGVVEMVGPDVSVFHEGDRVIFGKFAGIPVDEGLYVMRAEEIIGLLDA